MEVKLLALDMDGTTLNEDHTTISEETMAQLRRVMKQGVQFVPATGRMRYHLPEQIVSLEGWRYAITCNGAAVWDRQTGEVCFADYLDRGLSEELLEMLKKEKIFFEYYCDGRSYVEKYLFEHAFLYGVTPRDMEYLKHKCTTVDDMNRFLSAPQVHVEKIFLHYLSAEKHRSLEEKLAVFPVAVTSSGADNLEINHPLANKGRALERLCRLLGVEQSQVMAVGDNRNDLEMLRFAGIGVAMGNGEEAVKKQADFVTLSNTENGVAYALSRYLP